MKGNEVHHEFVACVGKQLEEGGWREPLNIESSF